MSEHNDYYFTYGCACGDLDVAQAAYKTGDVNVRVYDDYAIKIACKKQFRHIVEWLTDIYDFYKIITYNDGTFSYIIIDPFNEYAEQFAIGNIKNKYNLETIYLSNSTTNEYTNEYNEYVINDCIICYSTSEIMSRCNHQYCMECFLKIKFENNVCAYCRNHLGKFDDKIEKIIISK
jgi:hypothetical protein